MVEFDRGHLFLATISALVISTLLFPREKRATSNSDDSSNRKNDTIPVILQSSEYYTQIRVACDLAREAGANMKGFFDSKGTEEETKFNLGIDSKSSDIDFCTKVDRDNETLIIKGIKSYFPDDDIIGEESVGTGEIPKLNKDIPTWIIDPIDGTTNFVQGIHMSCVSIGYCKNGRPIMGVIYAPATDEWYVALEGHGAYRNGIRISQKTKAPKSLRESVVCTEFGYSRKKNEIDSMLGAVSKILANGCRSIRQLGSGCLDLCYVATGRIDIVYSGIVTEGWKPWDYCAGLVICQESGCIMEKIEQKPGEPFDLYGKSVLCGTSRELVDETRAVLTT